MSPEENYDIQYTLLPYLEAIGGIFIQIKASFISERTYERFRVPDVYFLT